MTAGSIPRQSQNLAPYVSFPRLAACEFTTGHREFLTSTRAKVISGLKGPPGLENPIALSTTRVIVDSLVRVATASVGSQANLQVTPHVGDAVHGFERLTFWHRTSETTGRIRDSTQHPHLGIRVGGNFERRAASRIGSLARAKCAALIFC